jgi:putative transposase
MMSNRHLARPIADMSFYEFRRQLEYKAAMRGGIVQVADRWMPSSKTCSACDDKLDVLPLDVREWTCPSCGVLHDCDVNAAKNLQKMAASSAASACGEEGAGRVRKRATKPASTKQEPDSKLAA